MFPANCVSALPAKMRRGIPRGSQSSNKTGSPLNQYDHKATQGCALIDGIFAGYLLGDKCYDSNTIIA